MSKLIVIQDLMFWLIFWLWCRWFGHSCWKFAEETFTKPGRTPLTFRVCSACGRVWPDDVGPALDALSADLDVEEPEPCERCQGEGQIAVLITRDMAVDAGDPGKTGGSVTVVCEPCRGSGQAL
jgi:hypothetical protein